MEGNEKKANWAVTASALIVVTILSFSVNSKMKALEAIPVMKASIATLEKKASGARFTDLDGHAHLERIHGLEVRVSVLECE